jgi:hypothetical protein
MMLVIATAKVGFFAALWTWVSMNATPIVAVATVVTAIIAIFALRSTARDSRDRTRPVVLAQFRLAAHNDKAFDLIIRNYGQSSARDVEVKFDPPFGMDERKDRLTEILAQRYDKRIPILPPEVEVSNLWWTGRPKPASTELMNALSTPENVTVRISYKGNRVRRYKEKIPLDSRWMKLDTSSVSSDSMRGRTKTIAESVKAIADATRPALRALQEIADSVSEHEAEELGLEPPIHEHAGEAPGVNPPQASGGAPNPQEPR